MKLVIVESPTKAKTLAKFLGSAFDIKASKGHVRDLPTKGLGVDVEHNFQPDYEIPDKAKKTITDLKKGAKNAEVIFLATDPDREGEAIAWHLEEILKKKNGPDFERVVFHELTKSAIEEAFKHPSKVNLALVDAQQARRILDRLVGYKLSPLLWKKVRYGLSAGRVQSVAVRLIVEKERERDVFKSDEYWTIEGVFSDKAENELTASLIEKLGKKIEIKNEKQATKIESELQGVSFEVKAVEKSERKRNPYPPYKTSTLQQAVANVFGFPAKKTMSAAQKLFEQGFITYHRTDSLNLSPQYVTSARTFINSKFGKGYLPEEAVVYKSTAKNVQEAHEAIRPTDPSRVPLVAKLKEDEQKVYSLIWKRSLECQMVSAVYDQTAISIASSNAYLFKANGSVIKFDGWLKVEEFLGMTDDSETLNPLPELKEGASLDMKELKKEQHFTQPPARYSDASLIKKLEELGIGRPSTYAPTISTIQSRRYIRKETRYFVPEDVAYVVVDLLVENFPEIVDYSFTAEMEGHLDEIADENKDWVEIIRAFYVPFEKALKEKDKTLNKRDITTLEETDRKCPDCGKMLVVKLGKYGKFLSCSNYPDCNYAEPMEENKIFDEDGKEITEFGKCDKCENGVFVLKQGRFGKFLACSNYPKCKNAKPYLDKIGMKCPKCDEGDVITRKAKGRVFYGCSRYPECDYSSWKNPLPQQEQITNLVE